MKNFLVYSLMVIVSLAVLSFACIGIYYTTDKPQVKPEYIIELVNQDSVLIQTSDTIYKCHFDEIQEVIERDNL